MRMTASTYLASPCLAGISRPIQGGLYFSCLSRGHNLFGEAGIDHHLFRKTDERTTLVRGGPPAT